jgi:hypothetical protein
MGQSHTVTALRDKRAELGGVIVDLERRIVRHRAELTHLDAVLKMLAPELEPERIWPRAVRRKTAWFLRHGEGTREVFDVLRASSRPITAREIAEHLISERRLDAADPRVGELVHKSVQAILKRAAGKVEGAKTESGVLAWRLVE